MNNNHSNHSNFTSKIGLILATAGSAVGLGNIWRFPVLAGQHGGGAFLLLYIICVILIGLPLMVGEFAIGRHAQSNTAHAFSKLTSHKVFKNIGRFGVFTGWFILCYYIVVSAWALDYFIDAILGRFSKLAEEGDAQIYATYFKDFVSNPYLPVGYTILFILISHFIIIQGVKRGIEKFAKLMMPLLFIVMLVLTVFSIFTEGAHEGLSFLFKPDFSKITFSTVLVAMGQAFFSMSIAMGCLCTFASYFNKEANLIQTAFKVGIIDTVVAIMSGIIIFPAVFSAHFAVDSGASLVFIALPNVFQQVFSHLPILSYIVSILFYFLLVIATLTSVISLHEVPTAFLAEHFKISRKKATSIVTFTVCLFGAICSLSNGPLSDYTLYGKNIFDLFDFLSGQLFLPLGGLLIAIFVGWSMNKTIIHNQLTNFGTIPGRGASTIVFLLKYFIPVITLLIFLSGLNII